MNVTKFLKAQWLKNRAFLLFCFGVTSVINLHLDKIHNFNLTAVPLVWCWAYLYNSFSSMLGWIKETSRPNNELYFLNQTQWVLCSGQVPDISEQNCLKPTQLQGYPYVFLRDSCNSVLHGNKIHCVIFQNNHTIVIILLWSGFDDFRCCDYIYIESLLWFWIFCMEIPEMVKYKQRKRNE